MLLDIAGKTENDLLDLRNFGVGSVTEVRNTLERLGLGVPFAASDIAGQQLQAVGDNRNGTQTGPVRIGEVSELGLSARILSCLHRGKVFSIADLVRCTESDLLSFPNLNQTSLKEVCKALAGRGLCLADPSAPLPVEAGNGYSAEIIETQIGEAWDRLKQNAIDQYGLLTLNEEQLT
jgi:DNA-directed RNA polymerase alpha subunit